MLSKQKPVKNIKSDLKHAWQSGMGKTIIVTNSESRYNINATNLIRKEAEMKKDFV